MDEIKYLKELKREARRSRDPCSVHTLFEALKELSENNPDPVLFIQCVIEYIDYVIGMLSLINNYKQQLVICQQYIQSLEAIIHKDQHKIFIKDSIQKIFQMVIEDDAPHWCIKKALITLFNSCIYNIAKNVKLEIVKKLPEIYLFKLVDSISTYGDYDFQVALVETTFLVYGRNIITKYLQDLFPESQEISQCFADIRPVNFEEDVRTFLNNLNRRAEKKVFSFKCQTVRLGDIECVSSVENDDAMWIDVNLNDYVISWFCRLSCFNDRNTSSNEDSGGVNIMLLVSDVKNVTVRTREDASHRLVYFTLNSSCISTNKKVQEILIDKLTLVFMLDDNEDTDKFVSEILPRIFGKKFDSSSASLKTKVSKNLKADYQPLKVKLNKGKSYSNSRAASSIVGIILDITAGEKSNTTSSLHHSKKQYSLRSSGSSESIDIHKNVTQILSGGRTRSQAYSVYKSDHGVNFQKVSCQTKDDSSDIFYTPDIIPRNKIQEVKISSDEEDYETAQMFNRNADSLEVNVGNNIQNVPFSNVVVSRPSSKKYLNKVSKNISSGKENVNVKLQENKTVIETSSVKEEKLNYIDRKKISKAQMLYEKKVSMFAEQKSINDDSTRSETVLKAKLSRKERNQSSKKVLVAKGKKNTISRKNQSNKIKIYDEFISPLLEDHNVNTNEIDRIQTIEINEENKESTDQSLLLICSCFDKQEQINNNNMETVLENKDTTGQVDEIIKENDNKSLCKLKEVEFRKHTTENQDVKTIEKLLVSKNPSSDDAASQSPKSGQGIVNTKNITHQNRDSFEGVKNKFPVLSVEISEIIIEQENVQKSPVTTNENDRIISQDFEYVDTLINSLSNRENIEIISKLSESSTDSLSGFKEKKLAVMLHRDIETVIKEKGNRLKAKSISESLSNNSTATDHENDIQEINENIHNNSHSSTDTTENCTIKQNNKVTHIVMIHQSSETKIVDKIDDRITTVKDIEPNLENSTSNSIQQTNQDQIMNTDDHTEIRKLTTSELIETLEGTEKPNKIDNVESTADNPELLKQTTKEIKPKQKNQGLLRKRALHNAALHSAKFDDIQILDTIQDDIREVNSNLRNKDFNQTLSTTVSERKKRKLFNPDDFSYLDNANLQQNSASVPVNITDIEKSSKRKNVEENVEDCILENDFGDNQIHQNLEKSTIQQTGKTVEANVEDQIFGNSRIQQNLEKSSLQQISVQKRKTVEANVEDSIFENSFGNIRTYQNIGKRTPQQISTQKHKTVEDRIFENDFGNEKLRKSTPQETSAQKTHRKSTTIKTKKSKNKHDYFEFHSKRTSRGHAKSKPIKKSKNIDSYMRGKSRRNPNAHELTSMEDIIESYREGLGGTHFRNDDVKSKKTRRSYTTKKDTYKISGKENQAYFGRLIQEESRQMNLSSSSDDNLPEVYSNYRTPVKFNKNKKKIVSSKKLKVLGNVTVVPGKNIEITRHEECNMLSERNNFQEDIYTAMVSKPAPCWEAMAMVDEKFIWLKSDSFLGKYLVIFFYPSDFGFYPYLCPPVEIAAFNDAINEFDSMNAAVVGCSVDSCYAHFTYLKMKQKEESIVALNYPLITDPCHNISKSFNVFQDSWGHSLRAYFIIDPEGMLIHQEVFDIRFSIDVTRVLAVIKYLQNYEV